MIAMQFAGVLTSPATLAAPGALDSTYGQSGKVSISGIGEYDSAIATDSSGNAYIATEIHDASWNSDVVVFKLDPTGAMVWSDAGTKVFDLGTGNDNVYDIALDSSGRIYVAGCVGSSTFILRLTSSGARDTTFGTNAMATWRPSELTTACFKSISIDSSNRLFLAGSGSINYVSPNRTVHNAFVASFRTDGSLETDFSDDGYVVIPPSTYGDYLHDSAIDNNGKIVVAGSWLERYDTAGAGNYQQFFLARFNIDGSLDSSFANGGMLKTPRGNLGGWWNNISVDFENNYLLTGLAQTATALNEWDWAFDKYSENGTQIVSKTFDTGRFEYGKFIKPGPNGTIYVGAKTTKVVNRAYKDASIFLRLDSLGNLDQTFGVAGNTEANLTGALTAGAIVDGGILGLVTSTSTSGISVVKYSTPNFASAPVSWNATSGAEQIELSWGIPSSDGGSDITDYSIEMSTDNSNWSLMSDGISPARDTLITSLTPNTNYYFRIAAITSAGSGLFAYTSEVRTSMPEVPGAPSLSCSISGLQVSLSWSPSQSGGRFETGFLVQRKLGSGAWSDLTSKTSSVRTHSETTNSSQSGEVSYRLRSSNDGGSSDWSSICTVTAPSVPSAPSSITNPSLSGLNMSLSWSAPANGGMPIEVYEIEKRIGLSGAWSQVYNSGPIGAGTQTYSETKSTSSAGETHFYRIRAINDVGISDWSSPLSMILPSIPASPASLVAVGGSSDITISWSEPQNIGTSGPLTYLYQITNNGLTWSDFTPSRNPSARSAVFDSAIGGSSYRFRVKAVNAFGESSWSTSSNLSQLAASYTLTYIYDDATSGNTISSATYTEGEVGVPLPTPTRTGYTFAGWYSSSTFTGRAIVSPYAPSDSHSLFAKWTRNPVKASVSAKPTIAGTTKVSKTLTANKGVWTGYPAPTISYQWYSCSASISTPKSAVPTSCKKISGATKTSFKIVSAQKGKYIAVLVTGSSAGTTKTLWLSKSTNKIS